MRLLLDAHALLWWLADDPHLSAEARRAVAGEPWVGVSAATVWEISIKRSLGKLDAPGNLDQAVAKSRFEALPISLAHAEAAGSLPRHHDDPFDRMLVAQARAEGLTIVTGDHRIRLYDVHVLDA